MTVRPVATQNVPGTCQELRRTIPASLAAVEPVSLELRGILDAACSRADVFAGELLCREALANAVLHGCALDETRRVAFAARIRATRLTLAICDEGTGFDWRHAMAHEAGDSDVCGRGMAIYRGYADQVRFNRSGNQLTLVRRLGTRGKTK